MSEATKIVKNVGAGYKRLEMETVSSQNASYAKIYLQGQEGGDEYFWFDTVCLKVSKDNSKGKVHEEHKVLMSP